MTNSQRTHALRLARRLLSRLDTADEQHPDRAEQARSVFGITVSLAEHLTRGFADPNGESLRLLEDGLPAILRICSGEATLALEGVPT